MFDKNYFPFALFRMPCPCRECRSGYDCGNTNNTTSEDSDPHSQCVNGKPANCPCGGDERCPYYAEPKD